jgi:peptidyl-prolyl cis-trans isomerase D
MSIIQQIRDRAALLLTGLISISLIGFLVQDAFIGKGGSMFGSQVTSVGSIDGKKIELVEFSQRVNQIEQSYRSQGMQGNEMMTQNIIETIWNSDIQEILLTNQATKLGFKVTPKEIGALLFSEDAPQEFKQQFTDKNTGQFDLTAAKAWMNGVKQSNKADEVQMIVDQLIKPTEIRLLTEKYISFFSQGSYVPTWMLEKSAADNVSFASFSYVGVPYSIISDSSIKVTDQEIEEYVSKHKEDFKQEHVKGISFVTFSATPSTMDTLKVLNQLNSLKSDFISNDDPAAFVTRNNTSIPYYDGYAMKSKLQMGAKDSIINMQVGAVIGPYEDAGSLVLAKKISTKNRPDSVHIRHILVSTVNPQNGSQIRTDSVAKKKIDSIYYVIKSGGDFGSLAKSQSDDGGSKDKGGEYDFTSLDVNLDKDFANFIFDKPKGTMEVVKTSFGYHVIEVLGQKSFEPAYKVAYLSKRIIASEETDASASGAAIQFVGTSKDFKSFNETVSKKNLNKESAENIKEMDFGAGSLSSRAIVKWIFENKVGTVSDPFDLKDRYVVAIITNEIKEGVQPASVARVLVEPILKNKKKAEYIAKKAGKEKDLSKLAAMFGGTSGTADSVKFNQPFVQNLGTESRVIGAAFNKKNLSNISDVIDGQNGVFYISVNQTGTIPSASVDLQGQKSSMEAQIKQIASYSTLESLKKSAKIVDNRRAAGY